MARLVSEDAASASPPPSLYDRLLAAGVQLGSHESDLYALVCPESIEIIRAHDAVCSARLGHEVRTGTFTSQIDGALWYDIPFAYDPWWEARALRKWPDRAGSKR